MRMGTPEQKGWCWSECAFVKANEVPEEKENTKGVSKGRVGEGREQAEDPKLLSVETCGAPEDCEAQHGQ